MLEKQIILSAPLVNFPFKPSQSLAEVENYPLIQAVRFRAVSEAALLCGLNACMCGWNWNSSGDGIVAKREIWVLQAEWPHVHTGRQEDLCTPLLLAKKKRRG